MLSLTNYFLLLKRTILQPEELRNETCHPTAELKAILEQSTFMVSGPILLHIFFNLKFFLAKFKRASSLKALETQKTIYRQGIFKRSLLVKEVFLVGLFYFWFVFSLSSATWFLKALYKNLLRTGVRTISSKQPVN